MNKPLADAIERVQNEVNLYERDESTWDQFHDDLLLLLAAARAGTDAEYTCGCNVTPFCTIHGKPLRIPQ